jgi:hypothetical protein
MKVSQILFGIFFSGISSAVAKDKTSLIDEAINMAC